VYVLNYEIYGIVSSRVSRQTDPLFSRIVVMLRCGTKYSVIRIVGITPPGVWEANRLRKAGSWAEGPPRFYTTHELFETFRSHVQPQRNP
jgi:hypothetical protein